MICVVHSAARASFPWESAACESSAAECNGEPSRCFGFQGEAGGYACPPLSAPVCLRLSFIGAVFLLPTVRPYRHAVTPTLRGQTQTRRLRDTWAVSHGLHTRARILQHVLGEGRHRGANLICVFMCFVSQPVLVFSHLLSPWTITPFLAAGASVISRQSRGKKNKQKEKPWPWYAERFAQVGASSFHQMSHCCFQTCSS